MSITAIPSSTFTQPQLSNATKVLQQNFAQIGQDLTSGNLSAAQTDYSTLQQNLQSQADPAPNQIPHHHHGGVGRPVERTSPQQILTQLGQQLSSGNLSAAQQAYSSLQALPQFASLSGQTGTQSIPQSTGLSFSA